MQDPILAPDLSTLKPADRSANKPVYLVRIVDPESKTKIAFYKALNLNKNATHVEVRGYQLTKKQAEDLIQNPYVEISGKEINHEIPWNYIVRIENVTYKMQQQGNKNDK